ncbi:metal-dependent hydrolase [Solemya velum gill symbiont]|uniref:metal-dependent hydrolase n=2 Tax=Solemya velum gill symbiont TaxID=2340 RepID=UPI0009971A2F|nr:metal-dependent hydrolase [Solemya velum gill symbiont]OOY47779.1 hypothetical protein BOV93_05150 [Solemya velum gill symbiont]
MDPLTQGGLGASLAQSVSTKASAKIAAIVGFLAGMAADLDFLIHSETDSLLFLEYHRQFTHSLVFIPIGALIVAILMHLVVTRRKGIRFSLVYRFSLFGYATHAFIDGLNVSSSPVSAPVE